MAVFRRTINGKKLSKFYMKFVHEGKQYLKSCGTSTLSVAMQRERTFRRAIEDAPSTKFYQKPSKAEVVIPTFKAFAEIPTESNVGGIWWVRWGTPTYPPGSNTYKAYVGRITTLLKVGLLAEARLDEIDDDMLCAVQIALKGQRLAGSTLNRTMVTLKFVLETARGFKLIQTVPDTPNPAKEATRGFVVSASQERLYAEAVASQEDHSVFFTAMIDTAIEPSALAGLKWSGVGFGAVDEFTDGFIHSTCTKTSTRERDLPMTPRLAHLMKERWMRQGRPKTGYVFPAARSNRHKPLNTFRRTHDRLWTTGKLTIPEFRLYDLRHTCLTRLAESGADVLTIQKYGGWASLAMAQRYIHQSNRGKAKGMAKLSIYIAEEQAKDRAREEANQ